MRREAEYLLKKWKAVNINIIANKTIRESAFCTSLTGCGLNADRKPVTDLKNANNYMEITLDLKFKYNCYSSNHVKRRKHVEHQPAAYIDKIAIKLLMYFVNSFSRRIKHPSHCRSDGCPSSAENEDECLEIFSFWTTSQLNAMNEHSQKKWH